MVIVLAEKDLQAQNVMNVYQMSSVTSVTNVNQASLIIHHVKKVVQIDQAYTFSSQLYVLISDCKCNPVGSTTLDCGKINGECSCKETFTGIKCDQCIPNVIGDKCDACEPSHFNYPLCEGLFKLTIFNHSINFYFSACMCDPVGSTSLSCDIGGKCTCKDGLIHDHGI